MNRSGERRRAHQNQPKNIDDEKIGQRRRKKSSK